MHGFPAARSGRVTCRGLGLGVSGCLVSCLAHAADPTTAPGDIGHGDSLFLYLALGCFGFAGLLLGRRLLTVIQARRRRFRAVRLMWAPETAPRQRTWLGRWIRRTPETGSARPGGWETRTRTAEQRAEQALAVLRSELTPHLAHLMRDRLVLTLLTQRARLLSAQRASAGKVVALEHRLTAVQMKLQRQAMAYEERIAQLEKDLQDKTVVTRELLKFRVMLARQALDAVRPGPVRMN